MKQAYEALEIIDNVLADTDHYSSMALRKVATSLKQYITGMTKYIQVLGDPFKPDGMYEMTFGGLSKIVDGTAATYLTREWFSNMVGSIREVNDHVEQTLIVWNHIDQLTYGGYADGNNGSSSLGDREVAAAKARLVLKLQRDLSSLPRPQYN